MKNPLEQLTRRFRYLRIAPGQLYIVGGAVRDTLLGITPNDIDFVVVGDENTIAFIFDCEPVPIHPHAPVFSISLDNETFEVALARTETKTGNGSEGFDFELTTNLYDDLHRRDFTVNAIAVDVFNGEITDPFDGVGDLTLPGKILHPVSEKFLESPERVGRAAMMIARFGFVPTGLLIQYCEEMTGEFVHIPAEQKWNQFFGKMLESGKHFVAAFNFLETVGALACFPELAAMRGCEQHPKHHPEGNVLTHTLLTMETAATNGASLLVKSVMLMHDMGKPEVTMLDEDGNITAHGHEKERTAILSFMDRIAFPHAMRGQVLCLVSHHMRKNNIPSNRSKARLLRKLAAGGVTVADFAMVVRSDVEGRRVGDSKMPQDVLDFVAFADNFVKAEADKRARPLIDGHDLIAAGILQGKIFSTILDAVAEGFLAGELETRDQALELAIGLAEAT